MMNYFYNILGFGTQNSLENQRFATPKSLSHEFERLAKSDQWKKEGVSVIGIKHLIKNNQTLINQQINNQSTAPELKKSLLALSDRLSKGKREMNPSGK